MTRIDYSVEATADLEDIYDYSVKEWGAARADRYVVDIRRRIAGIPEGRTASRGAEEVGPGLRRVLAGRHVVFFREDAGTATVVRVLHPRMDVGRV